MTSLLLRLVAALVSRLSLNGVRKLGHAVGWLAEHVARFRRRDVEGALQLSLPEKTPAERAEIRHRMYSNLGLLIPELLKARKGGLEAYYERCAVTGTQYLDAGRAAGKGVIIMSAHMGNWELAGALACRAGYPTSVIVKRIKNRAVHDFWFEGRQELGMEALPARGSLRLALRALKQNRLLVFVFDQNMTRKEGVFVEFFGRTASTTPGLATLAALSGAPVVVGSLIRNPDYSFELRFQPPLEPPSGRGDAEILEATQRYTKVLEDLIRERPGDWLWIHRRWRTQPKPATTSD